MNVLFMKQRYVSAVLIPFLLFSSQKMEITAKPPLSINDWKMFVYKQGYKQRGTGIFEQTSEGIKISALDYRSASFLLSETEHNLTGRKVYLKWKANGNGQFMGVCPFISNDCYTDPFETRKELGFLSTGNSYNKFIEVREDVWYYTTLHFTGSAVISITSINKYAHKGGEVIQQTEVGHVNPTGRFGVYLTDNRVIGSYIILGECKITRPKP